MGYLLQQFVYSIGGILRWFYFQILNLPLNDKFQKNINYYIDNESKITNLIKLQYVCDI